MKVKIKSLALCATALSLWGGAAYAADIVPAPEPVHGGIYAGVFGGATWFTENGADFEIGDEDSDFLYKGDTGKISLDTDTGWLVGGVLGYNWADTGLRTELELSYSQANLDGFDIDWDDYSGPDPAPDGDNLDFDGDVSVTYLFGNLWYGFGDMLDMGGISPYIGGGLGVGFANIDIDAIEGVDLDASGDETGFAYQVGGGVMWGFGDGMGVDLGYRYRGVMLDDYDSQTLASHNVVLGFNFGF